MTGTCFRLEVRPIIPAKLSRLQDLANDLYYSWSAQTRYLFVYLDAELWHATGHNPKLFLRRVNQARLLEAAHDPTFLESFHRTLSEYDTYLEQTGPSPLVAHHLTANDLIAYFCLEFGFHESFPIYSGGVGILAGDHCKAASDLNVPLVAVGLLYRQGYFDQILDRNGQQVAEYTSTDFRHLPITPVHDPAGRELQVSVELAGRPVQVKIWQAQAGRIRVYLLDSDLPGNTDSDRRLTYQLYGGDAVNRLSQEMLLGIGGVRALRALGLEPSVWHINEGHAALQILERCREHVVHGLPFPAALELVAAGTVFTTHTPVSAGHDIFGQDLAGRFLAPLADHLSVPLEQILELGSSPNAQGGFNMTALALRGSRFHNGVSRIHGGVASRMEGYIWPQVPHDENPIGYVTNGIHVPTFLSYHWQLLFDMQFGRDWRNQLLNESYWTRIDTIPDYTYWSTRQLLKAEMLRHLRGHVIARCERNADSSFEIDRFVRYLDPEQTDPLIVGFARRFATYKRALLLFSDLERLQRLVNDPDQPVLILYAGKAHPSDLPGQQLIHRIHEIAMRREFQGKVILLENYNLSLARNLLTGVDVWLNTPEYPQEASGTSGQKAAINGVVNLSMMDGWWAEAYDGQNGWALWPYRPYYEKNDPHYHDKTERDAIEGQMLLDTLEEQVIPLYFQRNGQGYSPGWVAKSKASMKSMMPRFNAARMLRDYIEHYYAPARQSHRALAEGRGEKSRELTAWKQKILLNWKDVRLRRLDAPIGAIETGQSLPIRVAVRLGQLAAEDVVLECLVGSQTKSGQFHRQLTADFTCTDETIGDETVFALDLQHGLSGLNYYQVRLFPYHPLLSHRFELGCMLWL